MLATTMGRGRRRSLVLLLALGAGLATASEGRAQAWVPPAGAGSVDILFQRIDNTGHVLYDGSTDQVGSIDASIFVGAEYGLTDRLAVSGGIPLVFARFTSPPEQVPPGVPVLPVDACRCWHAAWQDVSFSARYRLGSGGFALTPILSAGVPSHAYPYRGEAVAGRRLTELRLGLAAARQLGGPSGRWAIQGIYNYAVVGRAAGIGTNRSDATADLSWHATTPLSVRGFASFQRIHGGLTVRDITTRELFEEHDRLLRDNNVRVGVGAAYSLRRLDIFGSYIHYLWGRNSHRGHAMSVGISIPFVRGQ
jgi:hypothetical protein